MNTSLKMGEESVRDKLRKISDVMDNFSLETMKIAKMQADLCDVKKENTMLKEKVDSLEQDTSILKEENTIMKGELGTMKNENTILKDLNKTVLEKVSKVVKDNTVLTNDVDTLRNDVHMLKSTFLSKVGQCSNERESDYRSTEHLDDVSLPGGTNEPEAPEAAEKERYSVDDKPLNIGRKPKAQRKREQNEIFRNWRKTMTQRKTLEDLWASGLLKVTIELWEDDGIAMDGEQILDFIQRNVVELTTFVTSEKSKERFFLTINKMCSLRKISKSKFQEIMLCFVNQGPRRASITESEVRKFIEMYKE